MSKLVLNIRGNTFNIRDIVNKILNYIKKSYCDIDEDILFEIKVILNELLCNSIRYQKKILK